MAHCVLLRSLLKSNPHVLLLGHLVLPLEDLVLPGLQIEHELVLDGLHLFLVLCVQTCV